MVDHAPSVARDGGDGGRHFVGASTGDHDPRRVPHGTVDAYTGALTFTPLPGYHGTPLGVRYRLYDAYGQWGMATYTPTVLVNAVVLGAVVKPALVQPAEVSGSLAVVPGVQTGGSLPYTGDQFSPAVSYDGVNFLVAWADSRPRLGRRGPDIVGARVRTDGTVRDPSGIMVAGARTDEVTPAIAAVPRQGWGVVYQRNAPEAPYAANRVFLRRVSRR